MAKHRGNDDSSGGGDDDDDDVPTVIYLFLVASGMHRTHLAVWKAYFETCNKINTNGRVIIHSQDPTAVDTDAYATSLGR